MFVFFLGVVLGASSVYFYPQLKTWVASLVTKLRSRL